MRNKFETRGETTAIFVESKDGIKEALVSTSKLQKLFDFDGKFTAYWDGWTKDYYVIGRLDGVQISLHRFLLDSPSGYQVDHINHKTLDNRDENLRIVTHAQNGQNRRGSNKNSKTGIRGVSLRHGRYRVRIKVSGKNLEIGTFDNLSDAETAAKEARIKYMPYSQEA